MTDSRILLKNGGHVSKNRSASFEVQEGDLAEIARALPESVKFRLGETRMPIFVTALADYIAETYDRDSFENFSDLIENDPLINQAFSVFLWLSPKWQSSMSDTNFELCVEFIKDLPRDFDYVSIVGVEGELEQKSSDLEKVFGARTEDGAGHIEGTIDTQNAVGMLATLTKGKVEHVTKLLADLRESKPLIAGTFDDWVLLFGNLNAALTDHEKIANGISRALRSDAQEDRAFGLIALEQCAGYVDISKLEEDFVLALDAGIKNVEYKTIAYLHSEFSFEPSEQFLVNWLDHHDEHKEMLAHVIAGFEMSDPVALEVERSADLATYGEVPKNAQAKRFEDIFGFDQLPFNYPAIAEKIPTAVATDDGKVWKLRLPTTPQELKDNANAMDNCSAGFGYIDEIMRGDCIVLIAEPSAPDSTQTLAEQTVNAEYNLVGNTWYPIQVEPHSDGRQGAVVPPSLEKILRHPLDEVILSIQSPFLSRTQER